MKKKLKRTLIWSFLLIGTSSIVIGSTLPTVLDKSCVVKNDSVVSNDKNLTSNNKDLVSSNKNLSSISSSVTPQTFKQTIDTKSTLMSVQTTSAYDSIYADEKNNTITALVTDSNDVILKSSLSVNNTNIKIISYTWYKNNVLQNSTTNNLTISAADFSSSQPVNTYYCEIKYSLDGWTFIVKSGNYIVGNLTLELSQSVNNVSSNTLAILNKQNATLGLKITNDDVSDVSYQFGKGSQDTLPTVWSLSNSNSYELNNLSGLSFYYAKVTFTWNNYTFSTTTLPYVLDQIDANITVNNSDYSNNNDDIFEATNLSIDASHDLSSIKWFNETNENDINPTTTNSTATGSTYVLSNDNVTNNYSTYISVYATYSIDGYNFDFYLTPVVFDVLAIPDVSISNTITNNSSEVNNTSVVINNDTWYGSATPDINNFQANTYSTATLNVAASVLNKENITNLTYQWYSNSQDNTNSNTKVQNATGSSLTLNYTNSNIVYYFAKITYTWHGISYTKDSNVFMVVYSNFEIQKTYQHRHHWGSPYYNISLDYNWNQVSNSVTNCEIQYQDLSWRYSSPNSRSGTNFTTWFVAGTTQYGFVFSFSYTINNVSFNLVIGSQFDFGIGG